MTAGNHQAALEYVASWAERQMNLGYERMLARLQMSEGDAARMRDGNRLLVGDLRAAICAGDLRKAMSLLGNDSGIWCGVLEGAGPFVPVAQLAEGLSWGWTSSRQRIPAGRLLPLFQVATPLRATVPADWPALVTIYRGVTAATARSARRRMRELSWTTDPAIAAWFAGRLRADDRLPFVGRATVSRDRILAAFTDRSESECVVDPANLTGLAVAAMTVEEWTAAEAWKAAMNLRDRERLEAATTTAGG